MIVHKTVASNGDGLEFVLSDGTVDRYGDIVEPTGWDLKNFKKNPIALFGHNSSFPIGKWSDLRVEAGKLIGRLTLAKRGTSYRLDELIGLVEQGILRAVSVGFRPIKAEPIDAERPYGPQRYLKSELLETSLVSVPANPAALALAKSLNVSDEIMSLAFGEHAETRRRDMHTGEHADKRKPEAGASPITKATNMKTLSQRIEDAQNDLTAKKDRLAELNGAEELDIDAIEELTGQIDAAERAITVMKASEAKIGINAAPAGQAAVPAVNRRPLGFPQREVQPLDLLVRAITVQGIAAFGAGNKSIDRVLDERYPGHEATAVVAKADQTIGTTGTAGWASELVQTVNQGFLQALMGLSVYPALRSRGVGLTFDGIGTIKLPRRTAGGAGGGFVAEGDPIRVGRITTAAAELTPKKMGVIVPFSRELAKRSTPAIEALVRQAILEDTAAILDSALLDATASSGARPAGLLNGVSAAASGYGGGDHLAVKEDFKALLAPFISANAADNITVIVNPAQALAIAMMDGPGNNAGWFSGISSRVNIVESTHATANRLIAIRNSDFYTAVGDAPEFDINETATVHMEDTTPLEIVSGTGPTTADPVRSFYQTATVGVRMLMDVSWVMGRPSMVQWINGTSY
jgi:HK97 family phage prohead protease/HK97 family phage major capsid protein